MAFIEWSDDLSVDIARIDGQHQRLIAMVNDLHTAMKGGKGAAQLAQTFGDLVEYTSYHFETEEKLFQQYHYPKAAEHTAQHKELIQQALSLRDQFARGEILVSVKVLEFLRDWVANHILGADKAYTTFFHGVGVS